MEDPTWRSPYFDKEFILYTFSFDTSYVAILTQNNEEGDDIPMSFMSSNLKGIELKYLDVEKKGLTFFKVVKHFGLYILNSWTKIIVPHPTVRFIFV